MQDTLTIRFWGVRGSYPVTSPHTAQFGGDTPCVEICADGQHIILDAGTGLIALGHAMTQQHTLSTSLLLLSHLHHDHTQGLPFFAPLYQPNTELHIMGPSFSDVALEKQLTQIVSPPNFPVHWNETAAQKIVQRIAPAATLDWNPQAAPYPISIRTLYSLAHPGGVMLFRLTWRERTIVYATDIEGYAYSDRRLIAFAHNADVLIHDAQYSTEEYLGIHSSSKQGWGHSTPAMALDVARAAHVQHLVLFHHDPQHDDDTIARSVPQTDTHAMKISAAAQGMTLELPAEMETPAHAIGRIDDVHATTL